MAESTSNIAEYSAGKTGWPVVWRGAPNKDHQVTYMVSINWYD